VRKPDEREAAATLRRLLDAVDRGELTAVTPAERRNVRRLEGAQPLPSPIELF
jgi:hypothetical protein